MAMAQSGLAWEDTSSYLNALDTLLTTTPDTDALAAWRSAKQELQSTFSHSAAHGKRLLQELQASYSRADSATAEAALPLEELRLRLEQVEGRKAAVLERVQRMAVARDASAAAMQRLLQDTLALREEQRRMEGMKQGASPQLQCVLHAPPQGARAQPCPHLLVKQPSSLTHARTHANARTNRAQAPTGALL
jgi:hypothetical protein